MIVLFVNTASLIKVVESLQFIFIIAEFGKLPFFSGDLESLHEEICLIYL